jgi:hypothetical protein
MMAKTRNDNRVISWYYYIAGKKINIPNKKG